MTTDRTTKVILATIALGLFANVAVNLTTFRIGIAEAAKAHGGIQKVQICDNKGCANLYTYRHASGEFAGKTVRGF